MERDYSSAVCGILRSPYSLPFSAALVATPVASSARPASVARINVGVAFGELVTLFAVRLFAFRSAGSANAHVLRSRDSRKMRRINAKPMQAFLPPACVRVVAAMVNLETFAKVSDERLIGHSVSRRRRPVPEELTVAVPVLRCRPAPASVRLDCDLFPESAGQPRVTKLRSGASLGHVRLLASRTKPRECVRTRRGVSRHFISGASFPLGEFVTCSASMHSFSNRNSQKES
jgi:hypothetical protein